MTGARLSSHTLARLSPTVRRYAYRREGIGIGIVHLGVGAFVRAHVAVYCDDAMAAEGGYWAIAGVSLRRAEARDRLAPQDCLYVVGAFDGEHESRRLVGSLKAVTVGREDPAAVVRQLADPRVKVVTLTVTEKGYTLDPGSGELDADHPDIRHDLENGARPLSTIGFLAAGLEARMQMGAAAPAILSCDNLPENGVRLRSAVLGFAAAKNPALASWIADSTAFPAPMVDRLVPAATEEDLARNAQVIGLRDEGFVKTETFSQWVIEDDFRGPRPCWEAGGALVVPNVEPYERAKLRLLNGAHSAIAYLGSLAGFQYVHEAMGDPEFAGFIRRLMTEEISPVTPEPEGLDHRTYIDTLLARFANPALRHRTRQIAMDGSQKLPLRLLDTVRSQLERGGPIDGLCLAVAAWMRYCLGRDEQGRQYEVDDPLAPRIAKLSAAASPDPGALVRAFLSLQEVFGADLPADPRFRTGVERQLESLLRHGVIVSLARSGRPADDA